MHKLPNAYSVGINPHLTPAGRAGLPRWSVDRGDCLKWLQSLPARCVDLVFTSPPYEDCRTYGIDYALKGQSWVDWMAPRVKAMCEASRGLVLVVMSSPVRRYRYSAAVEWLVADLTRVHGLVCGPSPYVYHRSGIPGSGSRHYHRRNWEPVYAFAKPDRLPLAWADNLAMGQPPKYRAGGPMSNRLQSGERVMPYVENHGPKGRKQNRRRPLPKIANPGNVIYGAVGGGKMGSGRAHDNEAPFPEWLADWFVRSFAPPGGIVCDPFCGSGTTLAAALKAGRRAIGCDVRASQVRLTAERIREEIERETDEG